MKRIIMNRIIVALVLSAGLAACGGTLGIPAPKTPAQTVLETKAGYAAALVLAVQYKNLPSCAAPMHPVLCSDAATVAKLQRTDDIVKPLVDSAQRAVDDPAFGANATSTAIVAAQNGLAALAAITSQLRVK